jgi:hypothetical protein
MESKDKEKKKMENPTEITKDLEVIRGEVMAVVDSAKALVIADAQTYQAAGGILVAIASKVKRVKEFFKPMKEAADRAHKTICDTEKKALEPLGVVDKKLRAGLVEFDAAQDRERRRREDEERQRRLKEEEEKRLSEASAMEAAGDRQAASDHLEKPVFVDPVVLQKETPKVAGISYQTVWDFRIIDETAIPREFLAVDLKKIGAYADAMKTAGKIPGVEIFSRQVVKARGA